MKNKIKKLIGSYNFMRQKQAERKQYSWMLSMNSIPNTKIEGEVEWVKRWTFGRYKPGVECFRMFANRLLGGGKKVVVSDVICSNVIEPLLNPLPMRPFFADKNMFDRICPKAYFPKTVLRRMNGFYYNSDYMRLTTMEEYEREIEIKREKTLVVKPTIDGISGRLVKVLNPNEPISLTEIEKLEGDDFIIQECVEQHPDIARFNPSSVNTLRMAVYRSVKDDKVHVLNSVIRIGSEGSKTDNAHQGGRFVLVDKFGKLGNQAFDQYGRPVKVHNNVDFSNDYHIPYWESICEFAKSVCQYVPHHRLLALDVVIKKDGTPCLLEFNVEGFSMWLFQFTGNNAFGEFTDEILEYCSGEYSKLLR